MKFAVICSAGGGAFFAAYDILLDSQLYESSDFILITDRECGAEQEAIKRGIQYRRILFESKKQFSIDVASFLECEKVNVVLMLYSRLVSSELFLSFPTLNVHPSILPSFKGINAVGRALDAGAKFIGASMHIATEGIDDGALIAQVVSPISICQSRQEIDQLSFLQKTYVIVASIDCISLGFLNLSTGLSQFSWVMVPSTSISANPAIQSTVIKNIFERYQSSINMGNTIQ